MKKFYAALFITFGVLASKAQLTQANHAPAATDTYTNNQCDSTNITIGAGGANVVWNYSSVPIRTNVSISYVGSSNPTTSAYPNADVKITSSLANDTYHYKSSANDLKYYGGSISVSVVAASLNYSAPAIYATYPMNLNGTNTNTIGGNFGITSPLSITGTFTGSCTYSVDGSGTLTLPGASNSYSNVLRVVTTQTMDLMSLLANGSIKQVSYNFYSSGTKAPIFTINTATVITPLGANTQTVVYINKDAVKTTTTAPPTQTYVAVEETISASQSIQVYPNPANAQLNIDADNAPLAFEVAVFDITGKLVEKQQLAAGKIKLNTAEYQSGLYLFTVTTKSGQNLKTGKFAITH